MSAPNGRLRCAAAGRGPGRSGGVVGAQRARAGCLAGTSRVSLRPGAWGWGPQGRGWSLRAACVGSVRKRWSSTARAGAGGCGGLRRAAPGVLSASATGPCREPARCPAHLVPARRWRQGLEEGRDQVSLCGAPRDPGSRAGRWGGRAEVPVAGLEVRGKNVRVLQGD